MTWNSTLRRSKGTNREKPLRAKGKSKVSTEKRKAWSAFSRFIRLRDAILTTGTTTHAKCVTCGKVGKINGVGCHQAGHWKPGRGRGILFSEEAVHAQCVRCNKWLHGNEVPYTEFMRKTYGDEKVKMLAYKAGGRGQTWFPHELIEIRKTYERKYAELVADNSRATW